MASVRSVLLDAERPAAGRKRDLAELCIGYFLILLVIWTPRPWQRPLYLVAAAFIFFTSFRKFESWAEIGLRTANLLRSSWIVGLALFGAAIAILISARLHALRPWQGPLELVERFWGYAIWAFAQQFLLQDFFLARFLRLTPGRTTAIVLSTGVFCFAHLPSPVLTVATLIWGLGSCVLFLRYHNLIPLAMTHAILGITIAVTVPGAITHNMRVGLGYLTYTPHIPRYHYSIPPPPSPQP